MEDAVRSHGFNRAQQGRRNFRRAITDVCVGEDNDPLVFCHALRLARFLQETKTDHNQQTDPAQGRHRQPDPLTVAK